MTRPAKILSQAGFQLRIWTPDLTLPRQTPKPMANSIKSQYSDVEPPIPSTRVPSLKSQVWPNQGNWALIPRPSALKVDTLPLGQRGNSVIHLYGWRKKKGPKIHGLRRSYASIVIGVFFFFSFPSYISGVHHFWVRFLRMWPFFNPTIEVVTFRLRGWCVLGVFLLPAFTRLGHERQDLLSPCDEMHVCTD